VRLLVSSGWLGQRGRSPEEVRDLADEILARPEFDHGEPGLLARFQEWLAERLTDLFEGLTGGGRGSLVGIVVLLVALAAVVLLVIRLSSRPGGSGGVGRARSAPVRPGRPPSAADWLRDAEAAETAGRWKEGLRCRHRALVAGLAEQGVIDEIPGRTAGEYRADVARALPGAATDFGGATDLFERAWYGDRPTGEEERRRFGTLAERVLVGAAR
jgi:hypothetical protein